MHRGEDDYLLTTRLFCGKCGAMMAGEIGTSHTSRQYRYYRCSRSKKHLCDKKAVKKDWIEDLVIQEVISLISDDGVLDDLAERIYQMQSQESNATLATKGQLEEVQKKLDNLAQAIAQGIFSSTTKKLLDDLEEQKQKLEIELFEAETRHPVLSKDQILHALCNYRKLDLNTKEGKQRLIDSFVNSIYLYDVHFIITFNYKGQSKTVTFEEVNSSPFTSSGSPKNLGRIRKKVLPRFFCCKNGFPPQSHDQSEQKAQRRNRLWIGVSVGLRVILAFFTLLLRRP